MKTADPVRWESIFGLLSNWTTQKDLARKSGATMTVISKHLSRHQDEIESRQAYGCRTKFYRMLRQRVA